VLLFFGARRGVFGCQLCDVNEAGARIRLRGLTLLPPNFKLTFDNFRTVQKCRLIWRRGDVVGLIFEN
jgi:hypothetical protein